MSESFRTRARSLVTSRPSMLAISVLFTAGAVWLTLRRLSLTEVADALARLHAWPFVVAFGGLLLGTLIRAARLHLLVRQNGASFSASLETIVIGYFFTTLMPLRTGELVRIGYLSRRAGIPAVATTAAVVVERSLDMIALAILASVFLSGALGQRIESMPLPPWSLGAAAGLGMAAMLLAGWWVRGRRPGRDTVVSRLLDQVYGGFGALGSARDVAATLALSIALWLVVSASIQVAFLAGDTHIAFSQAAVIMLATCFAIALPSTPGFVGTYHLGFAAGALLVGIPNEISVPVAIVFHLVIQVPFLPIGGLILFTDGRKALARPVIDRRNPPQ